MEENEFIYSWSGGHEKTQLECDYNVINDQKIGALIGEMTIGHYGEKARSWRNRKYGNQENGNGLPIMVSG